MPPRKKLEVKKQACKANIKTEALEIKTCPGFVVDGSCNNKRNHLAVKSGFCSVGSCEGTAPKAPSGRALKTCMFWQTCTCKCHETFDFMFKASGMPRMPVDNSGYVPEHGGFVMPTLEERIAESILSTPVPAMAPVIIESPLPDAVPATVRRTFTPTASGRAARGELESWVKDACDVWIVEQENVFCTPAYLAEEIGRKEGIKPPSVGAISAVFERWVKMDFAVIEKKPTRFTGYTEQGVKLGLDGCKEKARRTKKFAQAAENRGSLR